MADKQYHFRAEVRLTGEKMGVLSLRGQPDRPVSTPPEFMGHENMTSPQELFVSSAAACLMTTFDFMGRKVRAEWNDFSCRGDGLVESVPGVGLVFSRIDLYPKVTVADEENADKVGKALRLALEHCMVTNSMKCAVEMHPEVLVG